MRYSSITSDAKVIRQMELCAMNPSNVLLTGPRGTGKAEMLKILARHLLCRASKGEGCTCESCRRALEFHPDFKMIVPDGGTIKKDSVEEVIEMAREHPQISPVRVFLIKDAQCLNGAAANALLKVLEDSGRNIFLLEASGEVLDTISSRCRVISMTAMLPEEFDLGAEREMAMLSCENRIEYIQQFSRSGFFKKLWALKSLMYGIKSKTQWLEFFHSLKENDKEEFFQNSTSYERDAVLWYMSKVFYWTSLLKAGVLLPGLDGSDAIAELYSDEELDRVMAAIDCAVETHDMPYYGKNDWFNFIGELVR